MLLIQREWLHISVNQCQSISKKQDLKIRDVASFIDTLTSTFPANKYGPLYYRAVLKSKDDFLKGNKGNFNASIDLAKNDLQEIKWWAAHIPRKQNIITERESRLCHVDSKWMLSLRCLHQSLNLLSFKPDLDLFATQINRQFSDYVAYRPDPEAKLIDAFTIDWSGLKFYAFPPIAIISKVLSKRRQDKAEDNIAVLYWPNGVWHPVMLKILISIPILLSFRKSLLRLPQSPDQIHPMWWKMDMIVAQLSGSSRRAQHCQKQLWDQISFLETGDRETLQWVHQTVCWLLSQTVGRSPLCNHWNRHTVFNRTFQYWGRL